MEAYPAVTPAVFYQLRVREFRALIAHIDRRNQQTRRAQRTPRRRR